MRACEFESHLEHQMGAHPIVPEDLDLLYEYSGDVQSIDLVGSHAVNVEEYSRGRRDQS